LIPDSDPLETLIKPVVHEDAAFLAEGADALFFETHIDPFATANADGVDFGDGFVDETDAFLDILVVHPDMELPEQLTEGVFDEVTFYNPDFQTESHNIQTPCRCELSINPAKIRTSSVVQNR